MAWGVFLPESHVRWRHFRDIVLQFASGETYICSNLSLVSKHKSALLYVIYNHDNNNNNNNDDDDDDKDS